MLAISPQRLSRAVDTVRDLKLGFEVLSDPSNGVARLYGRTLQPPPEILEKLRADGVDLLEENADRRLELAAPATFVIDRDGVVRLAYADADYTKRLDPEQIIAAIQSLASGPRRGR